MRFLRRGSDVTARTRRRAGWHEPRASGPGRFARPSHPGPRRRRCPPGHHADRARDRRAQPRSRRSRPRRHVHTWSGDRTPSRRRDRAVRRGLRCRWARRRGVLPRRHRAAAGRAARPDRGPRRHRGQSRGAGRRRALHGPHRPQRPRRFTELGRPLPCSSPSSSTGAIASCRSGPTSWARTFRPPRRRTYAHLAEIDGGVDGIELWGPDTGVPASTPAGGAPGSSR